MRHFKIKNIFSYMVVAALVMALSISCKSNEEPAKVEIPSQYYGTWYYGDTTNKSLVIEVSQSSSGSYVGGIAIFNQQGDYLNGCSIAQDGAVINWGSFVSKNSDTSWTLNTYTFSFNTSTTGTLAYDGNTYTINKN